MNGMNRINSLIILLLAILVIPTSHADDIRSEKECLQDALAHAGDQLTLGEIRVECSKNPNSFYPGKDVAQSTQGQPEVIDVEDKRKLETIAAKNPYAISPHKRNYILPVTYNSRPNGQPLGVPDRDLDKAELKFQFSYKVPIVQEIMDRPIDLQFAYTNQSYWQAFNEGSSRPFRETNHEPELFLTWTNPWVPRWSDQAQFSVGLSHHSNGRGGDQSRSWNRVYLSTLLQKENYYLNLKIWDRIEENSKRFPDDPRGDDNPDIEKFMGHFELEFSRVNQFRNFSIMIRNNLRSDDNYGAIQLGYSFPFSETVSGYMEYFQGYGESLIDYNHENRRLGLGISISKWP